MKRLLIFFCIALLSSQLILADEIKTTSCELDFTLVNQDPYPAVPGEVVKVVFQIEGLSDPDCGEVTVDFVEKFPFTLDPESSSKKTISSGTYVKDFESYWMIPYKVRVDKDALDGDNELELNFKTTKSPSIITEGFQVNVQDLRSDFEVSVKDYQTSSKTLSFQILNIGENDVEALTVDIPSQESIEIKGPSRTIVGSLDSNDDTTFSFEAIPRQGDINLIITYTDEINERRTLEKTVSFDPDAFDGRGEEEGMSAWFYVVLVLVLIWAFMWYRKSKKRKHKRH